MKYLPSLALLNLAPPAGPADDVLLLGCEQDGVGHSPLPGVPAELHAVADAWAPVPVTPVLLDAGDQIRADAPAPEEWSGYRIIQIACHGELDPQRLLEGALLLGRSALRLSELFGLRLNADLVSLSARDLGRFGEVVGGVHQAGDEWLGFVRPLLYAGARSILVSLWKAHDGTAARLMPALHAGIHAGRQPADAFGEALSTPAGSPEGFWANWYLVGFPAGTRERGRAGAFWTQRPTAGPRCGSICPTSSTGRSADPIVTSRSARSRSRRPSGDSGWQRRSQIGDGPKSDHSDLRPLTAQLLRYHPGSQTAGATLRDGGTLFICDPLTELHRFYTFAPIQRGPPVKTGKGRTRWREEGTSGCRRSARQLRWRAQWLDAQRAGPMQRRRCNWRRWRTAPSRSR